MISFTDGYGIGGWARTELRSQRVHIILIRYSLVLGPWVPGSVGFLGLAGFLLARNPGGLCGPRRSSCFVRRNEAK